MTLTYKSVFLGCGPRAKRHAQAYRNVRKVRPVAACDLDEKRLGEFASEYHLPQRYRDLDQMLAQEKPDIVHMVTRPNIRVALMRRLADAGVPAVIIEKPACVGVDDYLALRKLEAESQTRFIVNLQVRFHTRIIGFLDEVNSGAIGEVRYLDASSRLPMAGQGVHTLDLMFAFNRFVAPRFVTGFISGYDDIDGAHPSPRSASFNITFTNNVCATLTAGASAPRFNEQDWQNKRIAVYGTRGFRHWLLNRWEASDAGGAHDYRVEDDLAQGRLTDAVADWLDDPRNPRKRHPTELRVALDQWPVILAGYAAAVEKKVIEFPFDPPADLMDRFRAFVGAQSACAVT